MRETLKKRLEANGHNVKFLTKRGMDFNQLKQRIKDIKNRGDAGEIIVASMGGNVASHYRKQQDPTKSITRNTDKHLTPTIGDMRELQDQGVKVTVFGPPYAKGKKVTPHYQRGRQTVDRLMGERLGEAGIRYVSVYDETQRDIYDDARYNDGVHFRRYDEYGDYITSHLT